MNDIDKKEGFDKFLTDETEADENVEYIQPDLELKLTSRKKQECREIVQEIKNFGVKGQRQMLYLIYLLSLEIENVETMRELTAACKKGRKSLQEMKKLILDT